MGLTGQASPHPTLPSVGLRKLGHSCPISHIPREGREGFPELLVSSVHTVTRAGEEGAACFTGKHHFPPTYVFVQELALVPVVQVNELGRALLLSVHPGSHILGASLRVDVGALPVPG